MRFHIFSKGVLTVSLLAFVLLFNQESEAQIVENFIPTQFYADLQSDVLDLSYQIEAENKLLLPDNSPLFAGLVVPVAINPSKNGKWTMFPKDGIKIWRMELKLSNCKGAALYFDHFEPGLNGKLFLFSTDRKQFIGAFTANSRVQSQAFAVSPLESNHIIIQFETKIGATDYSFNVYEIGLLKSANSTTGFGTSGPCEVNINCLEGTDWQLQKRGVAKVLVKQGSAIFYCSGTLINNTRRDAAPYFITANHCGEYSSISDYSQWIFSFSYEIQECSNTTLEPVSQSLTGAQLVSNADGGVSGGSDFKLLKLLQNVPESYNPYFNGWTRQNASTTTGVGIHHPDGDVKKISTYTKAPASSGYGLGGSNPDEKYWRVEWSETLSGFGVTEGGSSGSPLFDSNGLISGMLTGGSSSCTNTAGSDFYGKFSYSWMSNGNEASNQLAPWLDPDGTGVEFLGGLGSDTLIITADFVAKREEISINQSVEFENLSSGVIQSYEWYFEGGKPSSSTEEKPSPIFYEQFGTFDVQLIVKSTTSVDTLIKEKYISVKPFVYPNPTTNVFFLSFGVDLSPDIEIEIIDMFGRSIGFTSQINGTHLDVQLNETTNGIYTISVKDKYIDKNMKLIIAQ